MNSASVSDSRPVREIYDLGDQPPLGVVPEKMHAFCVRQERFGEPKEAWQREIIPVPNIGSKDVLVYTMATGINYNNVWAALGYPVDVIADRQKKGEPEDFHAGGSDCAGIVWAVGSEVTQIKVGDEVVVHSGRQPICGGGQISGACPVAAAEAGQAFAEGGDKLLLVAARIFQHDGIKLDRLAVGSVDQGVSQLKWVDFLQCVPYRPEVAK